MEESFSKIARLEVDVNTDIISAMTNDKKTDTHLFVTNGMVVNIKNTLYVITNFDSTRFASKINVVLYSKKQPLNTDVKCVYSSMELGLSLLEVIGISTKEYTHGFTKKDINPEHMPDNFSVTINTIQYNNIKKNMISVAPECIESKIGTLIFNNKHRQYYPKLPFYTLQFNNEDLIKYMGAVVMDHKQSCVGIINDFDNNYMMIPAVTILKFMRKSALCVLPMNKEVTYKIYEKKKKWTFDKNDNIILINNLVPNNDTLYSPSMKTNVPIDTYVALEIPKESKMSLIIKRKDKNHQVCIITKSCDMIHYLPLFQPKINTLKFLGLYFVALTYELMQQMFQSITFKTINVLSDIDKLRNGKSCPIMLIKTENKYKNLINEPFIHMKENDNIELLILKTINKKQILNMTSIQDQLKKKVKQYEFVFTNDYRIIKKS